MSVKSEIRNDIAVLKVSGKLMGGAETREVVTKVQEVLDQGLTKVILDLGKVTWVNSTGLGALMESSRNVLDKSGIIKVAAVGDKIKSLLMMTQIIKMFETFETTQEAVDSFN